MPPNYVPYDWRLIVLSMPWGRNKYIYRGQTVSGYPEVVMCYDKALDKWEDCPNINVRQRIKNLGGNNGKL